ncbi:hypothetical protein FC756_00785 [Lysinibacillus mangiferihumi]|uniref:Uncharacterized protein n=1 Tax=Lysinibacillus mangiferihumi TaxID=1130819 RepID=A0A4U2ZD88_9BACI|nr:hypothetical protein FC756_00785 [Lysinibacillus mangiferihumi]
MDKNKLNSIDGGGVNVTWLKNIN